MRRAIAIAIVCGLAARARADDDAAAKKAAQALVTEGVAALKKKQYDDALAKFQAAYAKYPSPKILLDLGTTLKEMGRLAEAANTYQKYLGDPEVGADRLAEVRKILDGLDDKLVLLTIDVMPAGSSLSIDGGAWQVIGPSYVVRVEPGKHVIQAKRAGFEVAEEKIDEKAGEKKGISLTLQVEQQTVTTQTQTQNQTETQTENQNQTGTGKGRGTGRDQNHDDNPTGGGHVHVGHSGTTNTRVATAEDDAVPFEAPKEEEAWSQLPGVAVQARIDGKLRGAAAAVGIEYSPVPQVDAELAALFSNSFGMYIGGRYRVLPAKIGLTAGGGVPIFLSNGVRVGVRVAVGGEYQFDKNLRVVAELGFEHFFNPEVRYEANVLVPVIGLHGRLR